MRYPVKLKAEGEYLTVTFPDIPEAITQGEGVEDALCHALDALKTAFDFYFESGRRIPSASAPKRGQKFVELPPSITAKIFLHNEMVRQKVRPIDLAKRMGFSKRKMSRELNFARDIDFDTIVRALGELGKRLEVGIA